MVACFPTHPVEPGATPGAAPEASATYVGSATCGACHVSANEVWARSSHATALATLTTAQHGADPECLACHVTGFRQPTGWTGNATPALGNVGCESCHGAGGGHAASPTRGYGRLPKAASTCVGCHTRDNSPDFVWSGYWPQVEHGR